MRAYSSDLRHKILAAVDAGMSKRAVARTFGVGEETIRRYVIQRRDTGTLDPRPHPGRPPSIRPQQRELLRAQLVEHPAAILTEHCALWEAQTGVRVGLSTMSREIRRLGWTRKKERWVPSSGTSGSVASGSG
jgi:transposase